MNIRHNHTSQQEQIDSEIPPSWQLYGTGTPTPAGREKAAAISRLSAIACMVLWIEGTGRDDKREAFH